MGHSRLAAGLPRSRRWREVIELLEIGAGAGAVAAATVDAAEAGLANAANDPALRRAFWLLTQLPDAARSDDFRGSLERLGIEVSTAPSRAELIAGLSEALERYTSANRVRSGAGEIAKLAAVESLSRVLSLATPSLIGATPRDVQEAIGGLSNKNQFADLSRAFFARFAERYLGYFVDREVPLHVGAGRRFANIDERQEFSEALAKHCFQAAKIVESFAGGWYSKARFEAELTEARTKRFLGYAFEKLRNELRRGAS